MTAETYKSNRDEIGHSDPVVLCGRAIAQRIKRYAGDNRLISPRAHIDGEVWHPRCRLIASWGWSRSQGYGCSPFKAVRELGSERRETVRSLSSVGVGKLKRFVPSTRDRDERTTGVPIVLPRASLGSYVPDVIRAEKHSSSKPTLRLTFHEVPSKTSWLIGWMCKRCKTFSWPVLIERLAYLKQFFGLLSY